MSLVLARIYPPQFYSGVRALYQAGLVHKGDPANLWYSLQKLYQLAGSHSDLKKIIEGYHLPGKIDLASFDPMTQVLYNLEHHLSGTRADLFERSPKTYRVPLPILERSFWPRLERLHPFVPYDLATDIIALQDIGGTNASLMGEKAIGLSRLIQLGLPVPPGVVLTTKLVRRFHDKPETRQMIGESLKAIARQIELMGSTEGSVFGDPNNPLFLAIRSGAQVVTEGLLPTIQFVGLTHRTVAALGKIFGDPVTAWRLYLKHIMNFGEIVYGIPQTLFATLDLTSDALSTLKTQIRKAKILFFYHCGRSFPDDPWEQLQTALLTVAESCRRGLARDYSENYLSSKPLHTAIVIQRQVFGVFGRNSGAATVLSRDKRSGVSGLFGSFKLMATGDEVMTGSHQEPRPISDLGLLLPSAYQFIKEALKRAEKEFKQPVKFEIVIQEGSAWITQVGPYHLWAQGKLRTAVEMVEEGILTVPEMHRLNGNDEIHSALISSRYVASTAESIVLKGHVRVPGIGAGEIVFDLQRGLKKPPRRRYIFVIDEISPLEWEAVFQRAQGIILLCDPGSHFFERASQVRVKDRQMGIPVLTGIDLLLPTASGKRSGIPMDLLKTRLQEGQRVWLEATRDEGLLMDQRPRRKVGSVARFLRGEITSKQVTTRRARETVDLILKYNYLAEGQWISGKSANPTVIAERLLGLEKWNFELLRGSILESQWGKETPPPPELFVRHGAFANPSTQDFIYDLKAEKVTPFVQRLWEGDTRSPKRLAQVFVDADELQHAFMVALFRHLPRTLQVECLEGLAAAAKEINRKPGRGVGIYIVPRFLSVFSEDVKEAAQPLKSLSYETLVFIVENLFLFYRTFRMTGKLDQIDHINRNETIGVALRYPLLDQEEKVIRFLKAQVGEDVLQGVVQDSQVNFAVRTWFGKLLRPDQQGPIPEHDKNQPPRFEESLFRSQAPQGSVEEIADYVVSFVPKLPSLVSCQNLMKERGWMVSRRSQENQQDEFTFEKAGQEFAQRLFEKDPDLIAALMLETSYDEHSFSIAYFENLSRVQQSQLLDRMVTIAGEKKYSPGIPCGIFIFSRLMAVLALKPADSLEVIKNVHLETLLFILEDYFVFSFLRPAMGLGSTPLTGDYGSAEGQMREAFEELTRRRNPVSLISLAPFQKREAEAGLREYVNETYQRYDGLDPRRWMDFFGRLGPQVLEALEKHPDMLPGVHVWFEKMLFSTKT